MLKFDLNNNEIKVGSKVVYITPTHPFTDSIGNIHVVDVSKAIGIVLAASVFHKWKVEFIDTAFLPQELQHQPIWYIPDIVLELY